MTFKTAATAVLLLFVAASVVAPIARRLRHVPAEADLSASALLRPDRLAVYYFHGNARCPECRKIEACARQAVERGFAERLRDGRIEWRTINYQSPGNEHFASDYDLIAATVVLVEMHGGQVKRWKELPRVWDLVGNGDALTQYVLEEVRDYAH